MTTAAFNLTYDNTSDATFRAWAAALDTQILAMGWVHSGDTGQFNFTTGTRSTTAGTNYVIYKTNDGVSPALYLRFEYAGASSTSKPGWSVQAGFATDGAGNLTGTALTGRWSTCATSSETSDTTARNCVISGSTSRLAFSINMNAVALPNSVHFSLERNKTAAGADTNTGLIMSLMTGATSATIAGTSGKIGGFMYLPTTGGVPGIEFAYPAILTNNAAGTNTFGATTGAAVPIPLAGAAQNPGLNHLICLSAEMPTRDTTLAVTMYDGVTHTYYAIGPNWTSVAGVGSASSPVALSRLLQRYD